MDNRKYLDKEKSTYIANDIFSDVYTKVDGKWMLLFSTWGAAAAPKKVG